MLVTIGLFLLSGLPPAAVSGTAIAANLGAAILGTAAFARSGQLRGPETRRMAARSSWPRPSWARRWACWSTRRSRAGRSGSCWGYASARSASCFTSATATAAAARIPPATSGTPAARIVLPLGFVVALVSGLFGLGGQLLSVPLLISIGAAMLPSLGAAQAQSIVIAGVGTVGYALRGAIAWPLVAGHRGAVARRRAGRVADRQRGPRRAPALAAGLRPDRRGRVPHHSQRLRSAPDTVAPCQATGSQWWRPSPAARR